MEKEISVKCKECGFSFMSRFDINEEVKRTFCPKCNKEVLVIAKGQVQFEHKD